MAELRPFNDLSSDSLALDHLSVVPLGVTDGQGASPVVHEWTVGAPVRIRGHVDMGPDPEALLVDLGLDEGQLTSSVLWYATGTRRSGVIHEVPGSVGHIEGVVDDPIDGELRLRVVITVLGGQSEDPFAPVHDGTIVWEATERFYLSGGRARFPMVAVSFSETGLGPRGALWKLSVDLSDLEGDSSAALQLLINEDHPRREELLRAQRSDLLSVLEWDIRRHVIETLLDDEDVAQIPDVPEGTVGSFARQCLVVALGTHDLDAARTARRLDRSRFETDIRGGALVLPG